MLSATTSPGVYDWAQLFDAIQRRSEEDVSKSLEHGTFLPNKLPSPRIQEAMKEGKWEPTDRVVPCLLAYEPCGAFLLPPLEVSNRRTIQRFCQQKREACLVAGHKAAPKADPAVGRWYIPAGNRKHGWLLEPSLPAGEGSPISEGTAQVLKDEDLNDLAQLAVMQWVYIFEDTEDLHTHTHTHTHTHPFFPGV